MFESWKLTLPCTRAEAESLQGDLPELFWIEPQPVFVARELIDFDDARWEVDAYFEGKPDIALICVVQSLLPSAAGAVPKLEQLPQEDWLTLSQEGGPPVTAGRFYVHTSTNRGDLPAGVTPFLIEASRAFGTGKHETTAHCLEMLDSLERAGKRFREIVDIGTGSGLLAFAAQALWPSARLTASDIDPVSIEITRENAHANTIPLGRLRRQLSLCVATGTRHAMIKSRSPYELIIANILAGPLIELALDFAAIAAQGASLIVAGLLDTQAEAVIAAYRIAGFRLERRINGEWPCLCFVRRARFGWRRRQRATGTSQPPGDFGSW